MYRKHEPNKNCYECDEFDRTKHADKYPKKCKCGGFIHHELQCRGWDRCSFAWSAHFIECDKCGKQASFDIDINWFDKKTFEEQYFEALKYFRD